MVVAFAGCGLISLILNERMAQPPAFQPVSGNSLSFRIGHFSLAASKVDTDSLLQLFEKIDPDLLSIQDIPPPQYPRIHAFLQSRGYHEFQVTSVPAARHQEMAVYTRHRLEYPRLTGSQTNPTISGRLRLPLGDTLEQFFFVVANLEEDPGIVPLYQLETQLKGSSLPVFVLGNFNRVSWSTDIHAFKQASALVDSWQSNLTTTSHGQLMLLEKPKSHIFYSRHFKCISFETMAGLGMIGTYQFIKNGKKSHVQKTSEKF